MSFRREMFVPRGGPDGGDGGKGGDVWLVADRNVSSLIAYRDHPHRRATNGVHGKGKKLDGSTGKDVIAHVPVVLVAHPSFPARSVSEIIKMAKAQPGALTHGTASIGSSSHMNMA